MRRRRPKKCGARVASLLSLVCAVACERPEPPIVVQAMDNADVAVPSAVAGPYNTDSAGYVDPSRASGADDPFAVFGLVEPSDASTTKMRVVLTQIVNQSHEAAMVRADAGAGEAIVDTLAAGDSAHVRLVSTADSILVSAIGISGRLLGRKWVRTDTEVARTVFP